MKLSPQSRDVFYISDATAITCETVGRAVLAQFPFPINEKTFPYVESEAKLAELIKQLELSQANSGIKPIVFFSIVTKGLKKTLLESPGYFYDVLGTFIKAVENDLGLEPNPKFQRSHSVETNSDRYFDRIGAIEYTLARDDGITLKGLDQADIILLGVSRSGKTPTSLYMAMQLGLRVVNYPFIADDVHDAKLLPEFQMYRHKLFGLTIDPERLIEIRNSRFSDSEYASPEQCKNEVESIETLFRCEAIPYINTSNLSVEEIATRIVERTGLKRCLF